MLEKLPAKMNEALLPFQWEGCEFAIAREGRALIGKFDICKPNRFSLHMRAGGRHQTRPPWALAGTRNPNWVGFVPG